MASAVRSAKSWLGKRRRASARAARGMSRVCSTQPKPTMACPVLEGPATLCSPFRWRWRSHLREPRCNREDKRLVLSEEDTTSLSNEDGPSARVELALWVKIDKDAGWVTGPAARCALCYLLTGAADVIMIGIFGQQRWRETQRTGPG